VFCKEFFEGNLKADDERKICQFLKWKIEIAIRNESRNLNDHVKSSTRSMQVLKDFQGWGGAPILTYNGVENIKAKLQKSFKNPQAHTAADSMRFNNSSSRILTKDERVRLLFKSLAENHIYKGLREGKKNLIYLFILFIYLSYLFMMINFVMFCRFLKYLEWGHL
jgi:hypothetical protein